MIKYKLNLNSTMIRNGDPISDMNINLKNIKNNDDLIKRKQANDKILN